MKHTLIVTFLIAPLVTATAFAHHSFTATYDVAETVTIEGKVAQFLLRNPHSFLHVAVVGQDGKEEIWNVEWAAAGQLAGTLVGSLRVGDPVIVTGNPARDAADRRVRMVTVQRTSDGANWGIRPGQTFN
jgi:Family of unknown function (DUF6152)